MRGRRVRLSAIVLSCALCVACDQPTELIAPPSRRLVIHAILDASAMSQVVIVQYIDGTWGHRLVNISGAEVTITTPEGVSLRAEELDNSSEGLVYRLLDLGPFGTPLQPGGTYTLHVRTPTGDEASGTTTMPMFTPPTAPAEERAFERTRDTVRLSWNPIPLARHYQVNVSSYFAVDPTRFYRQRYSQFADTSIVIAGTARTLDNEAVFDARTVAVVSVVAVDDNYYTYYHPSVDPFAGAPPSRLTGAVGVFGAVAQVRPSLYLHVR